MFTSRTVLSRIFPSAKTTSVAVTRSKFPHVTPDSLSFGAMASASQVHLSPETAGVCHIPNIKVESAKKANQVLQENHDKFHMFYNEDGFHNHIAHHILTLFALGANPSEIQKAFDENQDYQRPHFPIEDKIIKDMADPDNFKKYLGQEKYFHDYVAFFEKEMDARGWQSVVSEYLFSRSSLAEDLLVRMFAGFFHPIIHLGFGIEFHQPAIIAEALAQAAIHGNWPGKFLLGAEKEARHTYNSDSGSPSRPLVQLIHETRGTEKIRKAPHLSDGNKVRDGILGRAAEEMTSIAAQWRVKPEQKDVEYKTAEMINTDAYFAGGAQWPGKVVKFDFFYMHCVNCSIFFSAFVKEDWMKIEDKARLLEWKGRMDLALYASRGSAELRIEEITNYKPKTEGIGWEEIITKVDGMPDDGHASKLIRALKNGEDRCRPYEDAGGDTFPIKGSMWLQLARMALDSVDIEGDQNDDARWVRNCGFEEAWENVPNQARL